jgi:hypothetical protein
MTDLQTTPTPAAATDYLEKSHTRVRVFTEAGLIEGDYAHANGVRLSDSLRNAAGSERYMLLTDVTIKTGRSDIDSDSTRAPFVLLNTAHASVIIPLGEV